ncbi:MAG: AEC family transporter [Spirulina sp. SIO3F2]|nr:AEC family transporter [Spirulina sp. SIO3F2]
MSVLFSAVFPIALIALIGFSLGRALHFDTATLARINIYGLVPALILQSWLKLTLAWSDAIAFLSAFALNMVLLYGVVLGISHLLQLPPERRKSLITITLFANAGNIGLPFNLFALGDPGLERAGLYLVGSSIMTSTIFPVLLKGAGLKAGVNTSVRLPVFWAALVGISFQVSNYPLPDGIGRAVTLLAGGAIPVALLMLGIQLSRTEWGFGRDELLGVFLRLVVSPLSANFIGRGLGLTGLDLQVLTLQSAMPVAVNALIWVTELGGDRTQVSRTVVLSTLLSFVSLPLVLWLSR